MFPVIVRAIGVVASIIGVYLVKARPFDRSALAPINRGFFSAGGLTVLGTLPAPICPSFGSPLTYSFAYDPTFAATGDFNRDGVVDISWTLPGLTGGRFPRAEVFELPFIMKDAEGTSRAAWAMPSRWASASPMSSPGSASASARPAAP